MSLTLGHGPLSAQPADANYQIQGPVHRIFVEDSAKRVQVLADMLAFYLERMDAVYEEDEKLLGHPRDPYHRVDVRRSQRHVQVRVAGELVADTTRARAVFETGLPRQRRAQTPSRGAALQRLTGAGRFEC